MSDRATKLDKLSAMEGTKVVGQTEPRPDFGYLEIPIGYEYNEETAGEKMSRKLKENPFVPIG